MKFKIKDESGLSYEVEEVVDDDNVVEEPVDETPSELTPEEIASLKLLAAKVDDIIKMISNTPDVQDEDSTDEDNEIVEEDDNVVEEDEPSITDSIGKLIKKNNKNVDDSYSREQEIIECFKKRKGGTE